MVGCIQILPAIKMGSRKAFHSWMQAHLIQRCILFEIAAFFPGFTLWAFESQWVSVINAPARMRQHNNSGPEYGGWKREFSTKWWWALPHSVCTYCKFAMLQLQVQHHPCIKHQFDVKAKAREWKTKMCSSVLSRSFATENTIYLLNFALDAHCTRLRKLPLVFHFYAGIAFI